MKRILMYGIVCLVLLQVVMAAPSLSAPPSSGTAPTPGGTAAASPTTVDIGGGYHLHESVLTRALTSTKCTTTTTSCWSIVGNKLTIYDSKSQEANRDDRQYWKSEYGVNEKGIFQEPGNGITYYYADDGKSAYGCNSGGCTASVYDSATSSWTNLGNLQTSLTSIDDLSSHIRTEGGHPVVQFKTPTGEKVIIGSTEVPISVYEKADLSKPVTITNGITTLNGQDGSIILVERKSGVDIITTTTNKIDVKEVILPDGRRYVGEEVTSIVPEGQKTKLTIKEGDETREIIIETTAEGMNLKETIHGKNIQTDVIGDEIRVTERNGDRVESQRYYRYDQDGRKYVASEAIIKSKGGVPIVGIGSEESVTSSYNLFAPDGSLIGGCIGEKCDGSLENGNNVFVQDRGNRFLEIFSKDKNIACQGTYDTCYDPNGQPKASSWVTFDECSKPNCKAAQQVMQQREEQIGVFRIKSLGEYEGTLAGDNAFADAVGILSQGRSWSGLTNWFFPDALKSWQDNAAYDFLNGFSISEKLIASDAVCEKDKLQKSHRTGGQNNLVIETAPGIFQAPAAIQAERTSAQSPALCGEDVPCKKGECDEDGFCRENGNPVSAYFYKISWTVAAPADEASTPYHDENGYSVFYNVEIRPAAEENIPEFYLYPGDDFGFGSLDTLSLKGGEQDNDIYIAYSPVKYDEICILFNHGPFDLDGTEFNEVCTDFVVSSASENIWAKSTRSGSRGSVRVADLGRKQI